MKKMAFLSAFTAILVLTGCATKQPVINQVNANKSATTSHAGTAPTTSSESVSGIGTNGLSSSSQASSQNSKLATPLSRMQKLQENLKSVYFNFNKYNIRSNMTNIVQADVNTIKNSNSNYTIKLEGNCDDRGSNEYNFALGLRRTNTVKKQLIQNGIDASRITMISYGKTKPVCTEQTQKCWQLNRRADFKILP